MNALVTGAARGIGRAIAERLAQKGARVGLLDVLEPEVEETAETLKGRGFSVSHYVADITDVQQVERVTDDVIEHLGPLDVLVNNAGTLSSIGPLWESDPERWFRDIRVNIYGTYLLCRAIAGHLASNGRGYIINMASSGGVSDPHAYMTSYAISKTGVVRLTEGLARELDEYNVKVFAIGPPAILTEMTRFIMDDPGGKRWRPTFPEIFERHQDASPETIAELIVHIIGGEIDRLSGCFIPGTADIDELKKEIPRIVDEDLLTLRIAKP